MKAQESDFCGQFDPVEEAVARVARVGKLLDDPSENRPEGAHARHFIGVARQAPHSLADGSHQFRFENDIGFERAQVVIDFDFAGGAARQALEEVKVDRSQAVRSIPVEHLFQDSHHDGALSEVRAEDFETIGQPVRPSPGLFIPGVKADRSPVLIVLDADEERLVPAVVPGDAEVLRPLLGGPAENRRGVLGSKAGSLCEVFRRELLPGGEPELIQKIREVDERRHAKLSKVIAIRHHRENSLVAADTLIPIEKTESDLFYSDLDRLRLGR